MKSGQRQILRVNNSQKNFSFNRNEAMTFPDAPRRADSKLNIPVFPQKWGSGSPRSHSGGGRGRVRMSGARGSGQGALSPSLPRALPPRRCPASAGVARQDGPARSAALARHVCLVAARRLRWGPRPSPSLPSLPRLPSLIRRALPEESARILSTTICFQRGGGGAPSARGGQ